MEHFFIFVSKIDIQHFAVQDSISIISLMIIITYHHVTTPLTHRRQHTIHTNTPPTLTTLHTLPTSPAPTILARYLCKHATHAIHASTSSGPFFKLVLKFPPLKNYYFRKYFDQKTIIIERHLQVYATSYSKFGTCTWMSS